MLKENKWNKKRDGTETKHEDFLAEFLVVLSEEREEFKQQIKNSVKIKRIFSDTTCFWNQENRNRKQDTVFAPFSSKNNVFLYFEKKSVKKRNSVQKMKQKKEERYTKWEIIFQDTEKTKHRKNKLIFQEAQQRKQIFFLQKPKK